MFGNLEDVESKYERITSQLQNPEVIQNKNQYRSLMKELSGLEELVMAFRRYKRLKSELESNKEILQNETDEEIRELAKEDNQILNAEFLELTEKIKILLLPKDPNDDKNIILEIRAGAGGDEASLFADELFRSYCHYASAKGWRVDMISYSPGNVGGAKEIIASILGEKVYSILKYESGVHRVQRVPKTETQGRVHTSTITVAVIPEADEIDVKLNLNDVRIDVFRSGGAGGQSVNTTDSAVRVTHIPTGMMVICQDEKSQLTNKEKALKVLYSRLLAAEEEKARQEASSVRLSQIGSGDRSERIRTYNFPQSRVTDHRIGLTIHQINEIMSGNIDIVIQPLIAHFQAESLKKQSEGP